MRTTALMLATALCGIGALSPVCAFAADPYQTPEAGVSGDAYAYQRAGGGGSSYSYRGETTVGGAVGAPVDGRVN